MPDTSLFLKRFAELYDQAEKIEATKKHVEDGLGRKEDIESNALLGWSIKALHLIGKTCGESSIHYKTFQESNNTGMYSTYLNTLRRLLSVFVAAREDYEGGYIVSLKMFDCCGSFWQ